MPTTDGAHDTGRGCNSLLDAILQRAEESRVPLEAHLELTHRCNAQCVHCYCVVRDGLREAKQRELTTHEVTRVLDDLAEMGTLYVIFSGGEVLVREDFFEIAAHAKRRGFAFRVFTNAIGLDEARSQRLAAVEPLSVELSIYSADPQVHDGITRVPGSFDRLIENATRLKTLGVRIYLKSVVMKPNLAGLEQLHRLGKELGVFVHVYGCELSPSIAGDAHGPDRYQLDQEELFDYFASPVWNKRLTPISGGSSEEAAARRSACAPGVNGCCLDPYGNVLPCVALRTPMGNIRERSFQDIWKSMLPSLEPFLDVRTYADLPECRSCELVDFCHRCHGDNLLARGDDWRSCHSRARMIAGAERTLYQSRIREMQGVQHE